jgi:predicted membrane protein
MKTDYIFIISMVIISILGFLICVKISLLSGLLLFASVVGIYAYYHYKKGKWR